MEKEFDFILKDTQELTNEFMEEQLLKLSQEIYKQELLALDARRKVEEAKQALKDKEAELITAGVIDGKNKETRDAQLMVLTKAERDQVTEAERNYQEAMIQLNLVKNYFSTYKAISRLRYKGD